MTRLLQIGLSLLLLAVIVTPLAECFDRWDTAGLDNDSEFAVFGFIFVLCLVLAICTLISSLARYGRGAGLSEAISRRRGLTDGLHTFCGSVKPHVSPPLRI